MQNMVRLFFLIMTPFVGGLFSIPGLSKCPLSDSILLIVLSTVAVGSYSSLVIPYIFLTEDS
jgi:hypothetical protein